MYTFNAKNASVKAISGHNTPTNVAMTMVTDDIFIALLPQKSLCVSSSLCVLMVMSESCPIHYAPKALPKVTLSLLTQSVE